MTLSALSAVHASSIDRTAVRIPICIVCTLFMTASQRECVFTNWYFILSHQWGKAATSFYVKKHEQGGTTENGHICRTTQKSSGLGGVFEEAVELLTCWNENVCFILLLVKVVAGCFICLNF